MRVLQVLHDRERGGVETLSGMIETGLAPRGFAFETEYLYPHAGVSTLTKIGCVIRMTRRICRGDFDTLITYQSTASVLAGAIGALAGCRLRVVHQTCTPAATPRIVRWLDKIVGTLGLYSVNIINSAATWAEFARYPARYRRSMVLIEHGLDTPLPVLSRSQTRRQFNLPSTKPLLLNVGRLAAQKNQGVLIRALACLPDAQLVIAGAGPDKAALHELAVTLGVDDRLHLLGGLPAEDIANLYAAADLFVFPSTWETFGLAAVEAAMAGLPIVATDLPVLREVLRGDGSQPVAFVKFDDVEAWIAAIARALAAPSARPAAAFADALRRKYSRQRMIESYLSLFAAVTPRRHNELAGLQTLPKEARS